MKVRDAIRMIEEDGWFLVATRGSHRQYKHPTKPGRAQGAGLMRYAVVIEKADGNFSGYVPDLPGCVATGETVKAVEAELRDAIRFHIEGLKADGM